MVKYYIFLILEIILLNMAKISIDIRKLVIKKLKEGLSQRKISKHAIQHMIRKLQHGTLRNLSKSGRRPKNTQRSERSLNQMSKKNPQKTARDLFINWKSSQTNSLSTVKRILRKYGLFGRFAAKKPYLNERHIKNRLKWCRDYSKLLPSFWNKVIFSDESRIKLFSRRRQYVRRPQGSKYSPKYITKTVKFGGNSIMVSGAIKEDGTRVLLRCPDRMNSDAYKNVLKRGLLQIYEAQNIFQQDNAPCHKSKLVSFLDLKKICVLSDWPAQSPDLNIIEPLWADLKARVHSCRPTNIEALWKNLEEQWAMIPTSTIKNLYESMPRKMQEVIKNKGVSTRY